MPSNPWSSAWLVADTATSTPAFTSASPSSWGLLKYGKSSSPCSVPPRIVSWFTMEMSAPENSSARFAKKWS